MTKNEQQGINSICENMYDSMMSEWGDTLVAWSDCGRLRTCQARVYESDNYIILVSYKTIVAFIDKNEEMFIDILRWTYVYTATSAQHIAKFFNDYGRGCTRYRYYDI